MARLWTEGFELLDGEFFDQLSGSDYTFWVGTGARSGIGAFGFTNSDVAALKYLPALSEIYYRAGVKLYRGMSPSLCQLIEWDQDTFGTNHGSIGYNPATSKLEAYVGDALVATGSYSIGWEYWWLLEVHVKIAGAGGVIQTRVNGSLDISYTGDTQGAGGTSIVQLAWCGNGNVIQYHDDLACNDTVGADDNAWPGDGRVLALRPAQDGASIQWKGSDGDESDNYQLVDDIPYAGEGSPGDYVYANPATAKKDLYSATSSTATGPRHVWAEARAHKQLESMSPPVNASLRVGISLSGGTSDHFGPAALVTNTGWGRFMSDAFAKNPDTGQPWTPGELAGVQIGIKAEFA